ncbi:MAG: IgGFc-binding protein, partial [Bacteroidetes bacterium]|nr:IgGFc-binding protein [Bacteroidota bacterium]
MKLFFTSVFILTFCSLEIFAQNISNEGTEFWLCFPSHVAAGGSAGGLASLSVFITSKNNTSGVVTCGTSKPIPFSVVANTVTEVVVDRNASYLPASTTYINQGIRVLIDDGQPKAVVYAHVFAGARSAATLVLPKVALGQKYYTIAYSQQYNTGGSKSQFEVVCVEPNTKLNITLRLNGVVQPTPLTVTLANVGDVYQYQNDQDISGTLIEVDASTSSCKRFAAFSGSSALAILAPGCFPPGSNTNTALNPSYDPLFQQLYPLESWGQKFPLIPFSDRNTGAIFRVLASVNNTMVSVAGLNVPLNAGEFYETKPLTDVGLITADKPVMVAEYALTEYCADSRNYGRTKIPSDPDMVILNPLEYSIKDVTMYSSTKLAITEQFINVMILTAGVKSFKINKVDYSARFSQVPGNNLYSYAQINLTLIGGTNFNLTADVGFNAMAYGFGNFESYAYSAGTNLAASIFLNAVRPETDEIINNACLDEPFDFRLVLPYMSQKLIWTIDSGETITQDPPKPKPITVNGKLLFEYRLKLNKTYKTAGTKKISIVSTFPSAGGCS